MTIQEWKIAHGRKPTLEEFVRDFPRMAGGQAAPPAARARQNQQQARAAMPVPGIPFTAAAHEHREQITQFSVTPGASGAQFGPFDVSAYGYLANLVIEISGTGGVLGTGVLGADYPWNLFSSIQLQDVNGAPIFGPLDGFAALQSNVWGAFSGRQDPRLAPDYVGTINPTFLFRIPIQISRHNGFGCLANMNAAAAYKLILSTNTFTSQMATLGTATAPTYTVRVHLEAWSLPTPTDMAGRPQAISPPQHGTTQYWSYSQFGGLVVGAQTLQANRMGNLVRGFIFICRDNTGARSDGVFPDPFTLSWDARQLTNETQRLRRTVAADQLVPTATRDTGVFPLMFNNLLRGVGGDEDPHLWLPTVQSTRMEIQGNSTVAGSIQWITNDVAIAEVVPEQRFVEASATGYHPEVGARIPGAF